MSAFTILVAGDAPALASRIIPDLRDATYLVTEFRTVAATVAMRAPDLLLVDVTDHAPQDRTLTATIRAQAPPLGSVPILGVADRPLDAAARHAAGVDAVLLADCDRVTMLSAVAAWDPSGITAGIARLAAVFGTSDVAALVTRFEAQLAAALAELDQRTDRAAAHRIAGIAGTLGFDRVGQTWLALSEGDDTMSDAARRDARVALHATARARHESRLY